MTALTEQLADQLADQLALRPAAWADVCGIDDLAPERAVAALIPFGRSASGGYSSRQVALVRLHDGAVHAVDNRDPFCDANVMARGIVGTRGEAAVLISPMYKQAFDLATGICLDDANVVLGVYPVRVVDGRVLIGTPG